MPSYVFACKVCGKVHEVLQDINDVHEYTCCGKGCIRVFSVPEVKLNRGFFSVTLGKEVKSQTDFESKLGELRYMNELTEELGDNATPKDEWIEKRALREEKVKQRVKETDEAIERENAKRGWYKSIETFKFEPERYR